MMPSRSYCVAIALAVLIVFTGCSGDTAWNIEFEDVNLSESSSGFVFQGTIQREGSVGVQEGHTVKGISIRFIDDNKLIKENKIGDMGTYSENKIKVELPEKPEFVLIKYDSATSAADAGSVIGLKINQGDLSYSSYSDYNPKY